MVRITFNYLTVVHNIEEGFTISRQPATTGTFPATRHFSFTVEAKRVSFPYTNGFTVDFFVERH